ncbi:hypothetical protein [Streptomyces sp. SCSIO ZS0520]|uniref:hypothetical protein n=1 Tax=Streptomyces sp. SCSIO ZS0520 TaxID=2892996 RepID=UPI0021DB10A0|nr:hypothetical protein [Streptomyces sp. SCSIO ZS0520]
MSSLPSAASPAQDPPPPTVAVALATGYVGGYLAAAQDVGFGALVAAAAGAVAWLTRR